MFKTIVAATDGSDHADKAVAVAGDLAAKYDAEITLLHVRLRRNTEAADLRRLIDVQKLPDNLREEFERIETLQAARDLGTAGVAVSVSIPFSPEIIIGVGNAITEKAEAIAKEHGVSRIDSVMAGGDAADVILNCAKDRNADLIVMGTRGLSDLKGLFVGSVSHKVSHLADCSCIMVR
jgi:nucleotide-binding universal stress UspA family protein